MTRARAIMVCAVRGHRWGAVSPAGVYAPRCVCARCGISYQQHAAPLTPREALKAAPMLLVAALVAVVVVLIAGGAA